MAVDRIRQDAASGKHTGDQLVMAANLRDGERAQFPRRVEPRPPWLAERRGLNVEEVIGGRSKLRLGIRNAAARESLAAARIMPECVSIQKDFAPVERRLPSRFPAQWIECEVLDRRRRRMAVGLARSRQRCEPQQATTKSPSHSHGGTRMSHFLSGLPLWTLIALIVIVPTALAMIAQLLIRRWVGIETLVKNNEIAGFKFATVGVIYAVLLAFSVIVVWEKFNDAQTSVAEEAGATAALFRYADGKAPEGGRPANGACQLPQGGYRGGMARDGPRIWAHGVTQALNRLYSAALALNQSGTRDTADMSGLPADRQVTAARRIRLHLATGLVPDVIWIALFAGALLTIGFTLFFGSENWLRKFP